jgi:hypothetical protein
VHNQHMPLVVEIVSTFAPAICVVSPNPFSSWLLYLDIYPVKLIIGRLRQVNDSSIVSVIEAQEYT